MSNSNFATIIPVASGKGGVGKSISTSNLAISLANMGHPTVAVDLDLGGSNLHTLLGVPNKYSGVGDYLHHDLPNFEQLLLPTHTKNLRFLPGDGQTSFMANISYHQKSKLMLNLQKIDADYVLLDLAAGSAFHTLDFFGLSPRGILVTILETPAIINMMKFLKNFLFRIIERTVCTSFELKEIIYVESRKRVTEEPVTIARLQNLLSEVEPRTRASIRKICATYRPRIIYNRVRYPEDLQILKQIDASLEKTLSIEVDHFGFIFEDNAVADSIRRQVPFIVNYPDSVAGKNILLIAEKVAESWNENISDSANVLLENTNQFEGSQRSNQIK